MLLPKKNIKTGLLHTSLRKLANPFFLASRYSGANLTNRFSRVVSFHFCHHQDSLGEQQKYRIGRQDDGENRGESMRIDWSTLKLIDFASATSTQILHTSNLPVNSLRPTDCRTTDLEGIIGTDANFFFRICQRKLKAQQLTV